MARATTQEEDDDRRRRREDLSLEDRPRSSVVFNRGEDADAISCSRIILLRQLSRKIPCPRSSVVNRDDDDNTRREGSFEEDSFVLVHQSLTGERTRTKVEGRQRRGSVKEDSFNNHQVAADGG